VLKISELKELASKRDAEAFERQLGPFALVQKPPTAVMAMASRQLGVGETVPFQRGRPGNRALELVLSFENLVVASLPPVRDQDVLTVGRLPDNDLVVDNPSVSKRHAVLQWNAAGLTTTVMDLGSRNGTRIDGQTIAPQQGRPVNDGDVLSFGDVDYWFLHAGSLHRRLWALPTPG
jgi:hypothetical protein